MTYERRHYTREVPEIERRSNGKETTLIFRGYAARFYTSGEDGTEYQWGDVYERIAPGAFTKSLKSGRSVLGTFNHNNDLLLGSTRAGTMTLKQDKRGLFYDIRATDTDVARRVWAWIESGDVQDSSFGFLVKKEVWETLDDRDIRTIEEAEVFDVGPVTEGAYSATTVEAASRGCRRVAEVKKALAHLDSWCRMAASG